MTKTLNKTTHVIILTAALSLFAFFAFAAFSTESASAQIIFGQDRQTESTGEQVSWNCRILGIGCTGGEVTEPPVVVDPFGGLGSLPTGGQSIVWNHTVNGTICSTGGDGYRYCDLHVDNPNISIQYHTSIVEVDDTGNEVRAISCGENVSVGTKIKFAPKYHEYTDIYWFGTGGYFDSPYGEWRAGAAPTTVGCYPKDYVSSSSAYGYTVHTYMPLVVNPPSKNLSASNGFDCSGYTCSATGEGDQSLKLVFDATYGKLYQRLAAYQSRAYFDANPTACAYHDNSHNSPMVLVTEKKRNLGDFSVPPVVFNLQIPEQAISCPITVINPDNPIIGDPPTTPSILPGGTCTYNSTTDTFNMTFQVRSSDSDGDDVKYGIDWNPETFADQWTPYYTQNTHATITKSWTSGGTKTFRVIAKDQQGLSSGWSQADSIFCDPDDRTNDDDDGDGVGSFIWDQGDGDDGNNFGNSTGEIVEFKARPSLVQHNETTHLYWDTEGFTNSQCTVTSDNDTTAPWTRADSPTGGQESGPITEQTTYTLTCANTNGTLTDTETVNILPTFREL